MDPTDINDAAQDKDVQCHTDTAHAPISIRPPIFDQWLACLKFMSGWTATRSQSEVQLTLALHEHLDSEGMDHPETVHRLCAIIVPMLLNLESIDAVVSKHLRVEARRNLTYVQVAILRIVTFEVCREADAKRERGDKAKEDKAAKRSRKRHLNTETHFANDFSPLAKVVGHFRFDAVFSKATRDLILSLRKSPGHEVEASSTLVLAKIL